MTGSHSGWLGVPVKGGERRRLPTDPTGSLRRAKRLSAGWPVGDEGILPVGASFHQFEPQVPRREAPTGEAARAGVGWGAPPLHRFFARARTGLATMRRTTGPDGQRAWPNSRSFTSAPSRISAASRMLFVSAWRRWTAWADSGRTAGCA